MSVIFAALLSTILISSVICEDHQDHTSHNSTEPLPQDHMNADSHGDQADACIDAAKRNLHDTLGKNYPAFNNLTMDITSPRDFYRNLFNQGFNRTTFEGYCKTYNTARKEFDICANSSAKSLSLIQLSLADYTCLKRVDEYAKNIECLQNVNNDVEGFQCRGKCAKDEQASMNAKNPPSNATRDQLAEFAMGDCKYTRCMAECRKEVIGKKCGSEKSELEMEALKMTYSAAQSLSDAFGNLKNAVVNAIHTVFPKECREALAMPLRNLVGTANEYLSNAMNETAKLFHSLHAAGNSSIISGSQPHSDETKHQNNGVLVKKAEAAIGIVVMLSLGIMNAFVG